MHMVIFPTLNQKIFRCLVVVILLITVFATRIQPSSAATTSPQLAYTAWTDSSGQHTAIYVVSLDGSEPQQLTDGSDDSTFDSWSPDGSQMTFTSDRGGDPQIYRMDADGGNVTQLTKMSPVAANSMWSPDGNSIAFIALAGEKTDVFLMEVKSGKVINLSDHPGLDSLVGWSPDGMHLAFWTARDTVEELLIELYVTDLTGNKLTRLTKNFDLSPPGLSQPVWSPDGKQLALVGSPKGSYAFDLYVIDSDGSNMVKLTSDQQVHIGPAWSPDGQLLAFVSVSKEKTAIEQIDLKTGKRSQLTDSTKSDVKNCQYLSWSPDGNYIACLKNGPDVVSNIFLIDTESGNTHQLTFNHNVLAGREVPPIQWRPQQIH